jgi:Putative Actinobacterial Holin-X, holin superfamily III
MPNPVTAVKEIVNRLSTLAKLHIELAKLELKQKLAAIGAGIGLVVAAGVLLFFMTAFMFATIAAALATFLPWWLALLIVTLSLSALAVLCLLIARALFKKATPFAPTQAIEEANRTANVLNGR